MSQASGTRIAKASANRASAPVPRHKSTSDSKVSDPRAMRTRDAIGGAFVGLLHRRCYTGIRVSDITRKAKVGRATFYAHFPSKDALLACQLNDIVMPMIDPVPDAACLIDATRLFDHILQSRPVYLALCSGASRAAAERIIQDAIERRIAKLLADRRAALTAQQAASFIPRFVAGTLLTLVAWALEQPQPPAPADLQAMFRTLSGRALAPLP